MVIIIIITPEVNFWLRPLSDLERKADKTLCVCLQRALREVGLSSVEELKEAVTKLSCSIQKLQDKISHDDDDSSNLVSNACM